MEGKAREPPEPSTTIVRRGLSLPTVRAEQPEAGVIRAVGAVPVGEAGPHEIVDPLWIAAEGISLQGRFIVLVVDDASDLLRVAGVPHISE
jgi:hypothetical protein